MEKLGGYIYSIDNASQVFDAPNAVPEFNSLILLGCAALIFAAKKKLS